MKKFLIALFALSLLLTACGVRDTTYDDLAACLTDEGAEFYGAFWCENCENQLEMFGDSKDLLPYTECAQGGKDAQPALCNAEGIEAYPTWKFQDGRVITGTQSMEDLADYAGCSLPGEATSIMTQ
jgi:hypothetical protein